MSIIQLTLHTVHIMSQTQWSVHCWYVSDCIRPMASTSTYTQSMEWQGTRPAPQAAIFLLFRHMQY